MKYILLVLLLCVTQLACLEKSRRIEVVADKFNLLIPNDTSVQYFPHDTTSGYYGSWIDDILFKMREPVLKKYTGRGEFIRFIWLRSFENPIVIRVNRFADTIYANIKELDISSEQKGILKDTIINLGAKEWNDFVSILTKNGFWNNTSENTSDAQDGVIWYLESRVGERYKLVEGWDGGQLTSPLLRSYLDPLIYFANEHVDLATKKGRYRK
ncbi:hypothetical protein [Chitinophaga sancti]|uniref:Uncharacterized protein n=1 Tax=Chitinophaga sancti TaxID=1004 RepID=A0A1K1SQJ4_9BACT|nr:hypothetical protein [Chitinophaga sancti]WQD64398.1 hypothetical protein U0033_08315 [Chitinophaga sancti]WQG89978.1 hypothetical protein SR876_00605 [Chitinophaga sancti]SFW86149.1 hypothetical protein SAMN05661012_05847 [Chitinophaga sancti]